MLSGGLDRNADAGEQARICKAMAHCTRLSIPRGRHALHLESDAARKPWLAAVDAFVRTRAGTRAFLIGPTIDHGL